MKRLVELNQRAASNAPHALTLCCVIPLISRLSQSQGARRGLNCNASRLHVSENPDEIVTCFFSEVDRSDAGLVREAADEAVLLMQQFDNGDISRLDCAMQ